MQEGNGGTGVLFGNPPTDLTTSFLGSSALKASKTLLGFSSGPTTNLEQSLSGLKGLLTNRFGDWLKKKSNPSDGEEVLPMTGELDSWEEEEFNFEESINKKLGSSLTLEAGRDDLVARHNSEGLLAYQCGVLGVLAGSSHEDSAQMSRTDQVGLFGSAKNKSITTKHFGEKVEKRCFGYGKKRRSSEYWDRY
jgi:hypothetical protein